MSRWDEDREPHVDRKTAQLCKQVERALSGVLAESHDARVRELIVAAVEPVVGTSQLRVIALAPAASFDALEPYREALARVQGWIRTEVAQFVNRKRAPELQFALLPGSSPRA